MKIRYFLSPFTIVLVTVPLIATLALAGNDVAMKAYEAGDFKTAHKEYLSAAQQGDAEAQGWTGYMYLLGKGVSKDLTEALNWYQKGAEQGDNLSCNGLGYMYENGFEVKKSYEEAAKWYGKAAEQGYAKSQSNLGSLYAMGKGVEKSGPMAYMWLSLAVEGGYEKAVKRLKKVKKRLSPADQKEGERLMVEWKAKQGK